MQASHIEESPQECIALAVGPFRIEQLTNY